MLWLMSCRIWFRNTRGARPKIRATALEKSRKQATESYLHQRYRQECPIGYRAFQPLRGFLSVSGSHIGSTTTKSPRYPSFLLESRAGWETAKNGWQPPRELPPPPTSITRNLKLVEMVRVLGSEDKAHLHLRVPAGECFCSPAQFLSFDSFPSRTRHPLPQQNSSATSLGDTPGGFPIQKKYIYRRYDCYSFEWYLQTVAECRWLL
ncbi:hypothetical protein FN846DRAFT_660145 [Sphaerosporella brunnea]|uniref:Uncharacterized protein n=1 Tax=Sphaerosporella brunnea TaxID=1250544 RepID=A0A5J5F0A4_9PEZI|nr:hypothetical protein FN846DRAFT_660145 [Sphaerosporella brunnea]